MDPRGAELLFQIITAREERASIACASNAPFSEWGNTFTDPRLAAAVVDRLTFNAHIIQTGTSSYRLTSTRNKKGAANTSLTTQGGAKSGQHSGAKSTCHSQAINARADKTVVSIRAPSSAAANSNTSGVPCPPNCRACSAPGNGFPLDEGWLSGWLRSAQCAASSTKTHSCSRTWRWA